MAEKCLDSGAHYVDSLRKNCLECFHTDCMTMKGYMKLSVEKIEEFSAQQSADLCTKNTIDQLSGFRTRLPLKFPDIETEIHMIALMNLLDCGRSFDEELKKEAHRDLNDTLLFGCMAMHLSSKKLDADFMLNATVAEVSQLFSIPTTVEEKVMDAVYKDAQGPLHPFADMLRKILNDTGRVLRSLQLQNLGEYILKVVNSHTKYRNSAAGLVSCLVDTFPTFQDRSKLDVGKSLNTEIENEIHFARKAQQLVLDLYYRFGNEQENFDFPDIEKCTALADSELIYILRKTNILQVNDELKNIIDVEKKHLKKEGVEETLLRVSSIAAIELLKTQFNGNLADDLQITSHMLDAYLRLNFGKNNGGESDDSLSLHLTFTEAY